MELKEYAKGNELFRNYFKKNKEHLLKLVQEGQKPKALFIGCSDSRVIPDMMLQTKPGDLFVLRNVGNFVPPFSPDDDYHATAAGIEYATSVLKVNEIIICGHSYCGACAALFEEHDKSEATIHTRKWLTLGEQAKKSALLSLGNDAKKDDLLRLTEKLSIINQIENILTYPQVKERFEKGDIHIHGWYYHIENGKIEYYDADSYAFVPLDTLIHS
ncbi:Carbonic anhydrase [hydrothermal vent metagenome]|uniref:carbonic anhydrase n=1 Tax=hydrothermal vent metagenome TaxID=652676 RepID=A0A1W1B9E3_9ZZZZ